jgi:hypothetical protein
MPSTQRPKRTAVAVALLALVALSGCSALSDTDSPTPTTADTPTPTASATQPTTTAAAPTDTPTPAPTPTSELTPRDTPTTTDPSPPSADALPPGLTDTGARNVRELTDAHEAAAARTPGVVTHTTNTTVRGLSVVATVRVAAEANLTRVRYVSRAQRSTADGARNVTTVVAANETSVKQFTAADGNVTLDNRLNRTDLFDRSLRGLSTASNPIRGALQRGNFTVADSRERDGETVLTLRSDRYVGSRLYDPENVVSYDATLRLTADGLVRSASERIVAQRSGNRSEYTFTYEFEPRPVALPAVPQVPPDLRAQSADSTSD